MTIYQTAGGFNRFFPGQPSGAGVTNGNLVKKMLEIYHPEHVYDPMAGFGTTGFVCQALGIPCFQTDIRAESDIAVAVSTTDWAMVKADILNPADQKLIRNEIKDETNGCGTDMIWFDPPYFNVIKYSGDHRDLSNCPTYHGWLRKMKECLAFLSSLLSARGIIVLETCDLRRGGNTYFTSDDVTTHDMMSAVGLKKEIRFVSQFKVAVRDPEAYQNWLQTERGNPSDELIELNHTTLTILRNNLR